MDSLIAGYRRFKDGHFARNRSLYQSLADHGQTPKVMMIGCSDSRVDPALLFDSEAGELFVVRNVANLVPPYAPDKEYHGTSAALEFGVRSLQVEHIVVLGHAQCGGVRALLTAPPADHTDFVQGWMGIAAPARDRARWRAAGQEDAVLNRICEHETIAVSLTNLMTFPWIRERVETGQLALHGWYFDLEAGQLYELDRAQGTFLPLD